MSCLGDIDGGKTLVRCFDCLFIRRGREALRQRSSRVPSALALRGAVEPLPRSDRPILQRFKRAPQAHRGYFGRVQSVARSYRARSAEYLPIPASLHRLQGLFGRIEKRLCSVD